LLLPVPAFTTAAEVLESEKGLAWAKLLIESFQRTVGRPLLPGLDGLDERAQVWRQLPTLSILSTYQSID